MKENRNNATNNDIDEEEIDIESNRDEEADADITPMHYHLGTQTIDWEIRNIEQKIDDNEIGHPKFQRKFVWNKKQASRLVESIMLKLPVPPLFFYLDNDDKYQVVDGWQRLMAISYFTKGKFPTRGGKQSGFALVLGPDNSLNGKAFDNFSKNDKAAFRRFPFRVVLILPEKKGQINISNIYEIFKRLNTGGTQLKDQEVRNCVCSGKLNDLLKELNKHESWRKILGKRSEDARMADVGLLLRCLALFHDYLGYKKPMHGFLTNYMEMHRDPTGAELEKYRERFTKTCDLIIEKLDEKPFHSDSGINPSKLDSIFYAFARHYDDICPNNINERFEDLREHEKYNEYTSKATTDSAVIKKRFDLADSILFG